MSGGPIVSAAGLVHGLTTGNANVSGVNRAAAVRYDEIEYFLR